MDGVPHITQEPIQPGGIVHLRVRRRRRPARTCTTPTTTRPTRSGAGCSARSSSSRRTRPSATTGCTARRRTSSGSATTRWAGSRSTAAASRPRRRSSPSSATRSSIRFMNEGTMTHPWHLHGMPMRVVARDGYPLGSAAFTCDTLGVNPGERWDVGHRLRGAGRVGLPLPHPPARRGHGRDVRHGHGARRPGCGSGGIAQAGRCAGIRMRDPEVGLSPRPR